MKSARSNKIKINRIINSIKDSVYFQQAFTHTSYCHEHNLPASQSYENLEFYGDSVLNFQVSGYIYHNFPEFGEGQMSKLKQLMVQESTLAIISREIGLAEYLKLGTGEKKNKGEQKDSILADIFESFLAALYLTKGHKSVYNILNLSLFTWVKGKENLIWDYKSQLQEYCQANKNIVQYELKSTIWEKNQRYFVIEVSDKLESFKATGIGRTRKLAEQEAAARILEQLGLLSKTT